MGKSCFIDLYKKLTECLDADYTTVENDASYCIQRQGELLKIFFEKSNGDKDWKSNFNFPAKPYRMMKDKWYCHRGFLIIWKTVEPLIANEINNPKIKRIEVVGYSHGGAIAALCCEYIRFNRPEVALCGVGFGAPRVLWGKASDATQTRFKDFTVIRNGRDVVTYLPPAFLGFRHVGEILEIGESKGPVKDHFAEYYLDALSEKNIRPMRNAQWQAPLKP